MQHPPLETIAKRLSVLLYCEQEDLCRPIIPRDAQRGVTGSQST
jgi:hypothetical protein